MKRRKVVLTIEAETVLTIGELKKLIDMRFQHRSGSIELLSRDCSHEKACKSLGTITQVQVNVIKAK